MNLEKELFMRRLIKGVDINDMNPSEYKLYMELTEQNLCGQGHELANTVIHLYPRGQDILDSLDQARNDRNEEERRYYAQIAKADEDRKKQFHHDWRTVIVSAIIGAALTLIVEHFSDILTFFSGLNH